MATASSSSEKQAYADPTTTTHLTASSQPHTRQHDPEKLLPHLTPVISSTSTVEQAIDAEAGFTNAAATPATVTKVETEIGPPPNGGFQAWLQVVGSFFLFFNCW